MEQPRYCEISRRLDTQPPPMIGIPRAIEAVFDRQSRRLEPSIRATLDLAAVLGRRLTEVALYAAVDLTPGHAAEALSRLRDEGYLREVRGDLEFRNELIRAQAYYAVAAATRQHLHRRVAGLLAESHSRDDKAVGLEIAWHHLRGGDVSRAIPFAMDGAEAMLGVGAPHGAEEILEAILAMNQQSQKLTKLLLLLTKALIDQSKAANAVPLIERLAREELSLRERAEVAMLRASAEFQLNRESGERYAEVTKTALQAAKDTGDPTLIAKALFECARAGTEEGRSDLIRMAQKGIDALASTIDISTLPMAILTRAFCRFSLGDPGDALIELQRYLHLSSSKANAAELSFLHSGMGIANYLLGQIEDALRSQITALELAKRVGDDARVSMIASNLCTVYMNHGDYHESVRYGQLSVRYGESSASSGLMICYTNLIDPYLLLGDHNSALECLDKARKWLAPERRWKLRLTCLIESASFALIQRNVGLALDLIAQMESVARGREDALLMPGVYWKMQTFRLAQLGRTAEAYEIVSSQGAIWRTRAVFHYLDILGARAWLEVREEGRLRAETRQELEIFEALGLRGRKELLILQGFLQPGDSGTSNPAAEKRQTTPHPTSGPSGTDGFPTSRGRLHAQ